jgi:spore germination protein GerM
MEASYGMDNKLKYLAYAMICTAILFVFVKIFAGSLFPNSAVAFEWEKQTNVYFGNTNMGSNGDCSKVFPVVRVIPNAETLGPGSLMMLLAGVSESEKASGYFTSMNEGAFLQKFEIKDKIAYIDFGSSFNKGVAGSCRVTSIMSQIKNTLENLPDINSVVISVNGKTKGILEP